MVQRDDDYDGNEKYPKNRRTDAFGFGEIGGIGQLVYHVFRFKDYRVDFNVNGEPIAIPIVDKENGLEFFDKKHPTSADIFINLCNLALEIDDLAETRSCAEIIVSWCKENVHPYFIDEIYDEIHDTGFDLETDAYLMEKDGTFSIKQFMTELEKLYNTVRFYMAIEGIKKNDNKKALALHSEGRYFTGFPFFEKYKIGVYLEDAAIDVSSAKGDLIKEMQIENKYIDEHPEDEIIVVAENDFESFPQAHIEELEDQLLDCFPDFTLRLKKTNRKKRIRFAVDIHSIFDVAWCTFARYLAEEPIREKEQTTGKQRSYDMALANCCHCGQYMYRRNNRQEYCFRPECQKARNANNQKMFRERKRREKANQ